MTYLRMPSDPFQFEWPVDQSGYEVLENPHDEEVARILGRDVTIFVRPRGGPLRYHRPLENEGLWLRFAETCTSIEGTIAFANEFGLLMGQQTAFPDSHDEVADFLCCALLLRRIADHLASGNRLAASELLNEGGVALITEKVRYDDRRGVFEHVLIPITLLSALLHQAAQAISGDLQFRRCRNEGCSNWFRIGARAHTTRREFCSDRCRVASARRQRKEVSANA